MKDSDEFDAIFRDMQRFVEPLPVDGAMDGGDFAGLPRLEEGPTIDDELIVDDNAVT